MNKREKKQFGAWVSLFAGIFFLFGAIAAIYIAFFIKPETATYILARLGHMVRHI